MTARLSSYRDTLKTEPLNADLHYALAQHSLSMGNAALAFAELKTCAMLGMEASKISVLKQLAEEKLPRKELLSHNQYYRFLALSNEIRRLGADGDYSVMDIGGGHGQLAQFIPDATYCLVEPSINGISGTDLPFSDNSFDYVVACHVLEHIDPRQRELFLDQLRSKARKAVILLNPFAIAGTSVVDRLQLVIDITGADWAKEHLECTLPDIDSIYNYAEKRGLRITVKPNGSLATTMAMVFVDYFTMRSGAMDEARQINEFFNLKFAEILDSEKYPNAYLVTITD